MPPYALPRHAAMMVTRHAGAPLPALAFHYFRHHAATPLAYCRRFRFFFRCWLMPMPPLLMPADIFAMTPPLAISLPY